MKKIDNLISNIKIKQFFNFECFNQNSKYRLHAPIHLVQKLWVKRDYGMFQCNPANGRVAFEDSWLIKFSFITEDKRKTSKLPWTFSRFATPSFRVREFLFLDLSNSCSPTLQGPCLPTRPWTGTRLASGNDVRSPKPVLQFYRYTIYSSIPVLQFCIFTVYSTKPVLLYSFAYLQFIHQNLFYSFPIYSSIPVLQFCIFTVYSPKPILQLYSFPILQFIHQHMFYIWFIQTCFIV